MQFIVKLYGLPERVVEAESREEAVQEYNRVFGIIRSVHRHEVSPLPSVESEPVEVSEAPVPAADAGEAKEEATAGPEAARTGLQALGIHPNGLRKLVEQGLASVEQVREFVASGRLLRDLPGIAEGYEAKILAKLREWEDANGH